MRARSELARLAVARCNNDAFRWEAAAILRRAIGFDGWCWMLVDPWTGLPTRDVGENVIIDQAIRGFVRRHPDAWGGRWDSSRQQPVTVTSAVTGRDLARDLAWRETFGLAGVGDPAGSRGHCGGHPGAASPPPARSRCTRSWSCQVANASAMGTYAPEATVLTWMMLGS